MVRYNKYNNYKKHNYYRRNKKNSNSSFAFFLVNSFVSFITLSISFIVSIFSLLFKKNNKQKKVKKEIYYSSNNTNTTYQKKSLMTECELYFYNILQKYYGNSFVVLPQVNLATIINKNKQFHNQYQNELFRNIDFGIFDKISMQPLLLIEINDSSHNLPDRKYRDCKVKDICSSANIKLITFYTSYPNKESYIINRIDKELFIDNSQSVN